MNFLTFTLLTLSLSCLLVHCDQIDEKTMKEYLETTYEREMKQLCEMKQRAIWNLNIDLLNRNASRRYMTIFIELASKVNIIWEKYLKDIDPKRYKSKEIVRQIKYLMKKRSVFALDDKKLHQWILIVNEMTNTYSNARICPYRIQKCDLEKEGMNLIPEINEILTQFVNYDELVYVWKAWRDATGAKIKPFYPTYVDMTNEIARLNNFKDYTEMERDDYDVPNLIQKMDELWTEIKPLYEEFHRYVAHKLKIHYGNKFDYSGDLIPAHVFGDMWAENWLSLSDLVTPYPEEESLNINEALKEQNYTVLKMFETADDFYISMGLPSTADAYNTSTGAMIEKPTDGRIVSCETKAYNFCNGKDYRIHMCANVNFKDFAEIHRYMSYIQYTKLYAKQKYFELRNFVDPAFADAVGNTIVLSVTTWSYLKKIGLMKNITESRQDNLNALMDKALFILPLLPFSLVVDKWRWKVFRGFSLEKDWNADWWELREQYQMVTSPTVRREEDFDPGSKINVINDNPYLSYFISHILEFQLYRNFCITAGQFDPVIKEVPLHSCDFYKSKKVGEKLKKGLSLGRSVQSREVLNVMTGENDYDASALLEYFSPLYHFMQKVNQENYDARENIKSACSSLREKRVLSATFICFLFVSIMFSINKS